MVIWRLITAVYSELNDNEHGGNSVDRNAHYDPHNMADTQGAKKYICPFFHKTASKQIFKYRLLNGIIPITMWCEKQITPGKMCCYSWIFEKSWVDGDRGVKRLCS